MTNATYVRLRQRNTALQKQYGGLIDFIRPPVYSRDDDGNEVLTPGSGKQTVYGTLTKLDLKLWGEANVNAGDAEYTLSAVTTSGQVITVNQGDNVMIDGKAYIVHLKKDIKPDSKYMIAVRVVLRAA